MKNLSAEKGFTLLEMSIVLLIISVVVGGGLILLTSYLKQYPYRQMNAQIRELENALYNFRTTFGRLPCPADITLAISNTDFGREETDIGTCSGSNFVLEIGAGGMIPTKTLGLSDEMAIDPWGSRIFYFIDRGFTSERAFSKGFVSITGATQTNPVVITAPSHGFSNGDYIYISNVNGMTQLNSDNYIIANATTDTFELQENMTGLNVNATSYSAYTSGGTALRSGYYQIVNQSANTYQHAVYVLFSTGENKHGAYPRNGGNIRFNSGSTNLYEQENCGCDSEGKPSGAENQFFYQMPFEQSDSDGANTNDDFTAYKNAQQLQLIKNE